MADKPIEQRIEEHLRQMAPHVRERVTAKLLAEANAELAILGTTIAALKNPNRCPNCNLAYTDGNHDN
jgi:hypothetical protein